jgi:transglutaminase-like putative cysteine protease
MKFKKLYLFTLSFIIASILIPPSVAVAQTFDSSETALQYYNVDYTLTMNVTFVNEGVTPVTNLQIWIGQFNNWTLGPDDLVNIQNTEILSIIPVPTNIFTDINNPDNTILYFNTNIPAGDSYEIIIQYSIRSWDASFLVNPNTIGDYNVSSELYINNTSPEALIESDDPQIISLATNITSAITNPYYKAKAIYDWVSANILYEIQTQEKGALWAVENGRGDCSEYTDLLIALCRSVGIPARKVVGWAFSNLTNSFSTGLYEFINFPAHAWSEIYFQNIGWIPVDATWANSGYYYFGKIDPFHLIAAKGQNITVPNKSFTEFDCLSAQWVTGPDLSDTFKIDINITRISTPLAFYSLELLIPIVLVVGVIIVLVGIVSKKTIGV